MKKLISLILCVILIFGCSVPVFGEYVPEKYPGEEIIETEEDGSHLTSYIGDGMIHDEAKEAFYVRIINMFKNILHMLAGKKTVEKTKHLRYYDSKGKLIWDVMLGVSFTYSKYKVELNKENGIRYMFFVYDSDFSNPSHRTTKGDDFVSIDFDVLQSKLGVPLKTTTYNISLRCDTKGNVT